jgi:tetratricopeptide (TPR) repeat protein
MGKLPLTDPSNELMREAARLHRQNHAAEAIAAYQSIVARWPKLPDAWYNLAVLQRQTFRFHESLASYQRALSCGITRPEEVHLNRGVIFSDFLRDYPAAAGELERALTVNPAYTPALLNLANLYEDLGKRPEASSLYARILAIEPHAFEALARFANVQPVGSVDGSLINRLRDALKLASSMSDRASLGFALGRLLDAAGDYREAFAVYTAANQASLAGAGPQAVPYDRARQQAFVDRVIGSDARRTQAHTADIPPRPIFIVGMFRSGSTLAEQLLAGMPKVAAGGEMDFLPRLVNSEFVPFFETLETVSAERLDGIAARYRAELMRASANAAYVTDKRPDNFLYLGLIKRLFPGAKIVHTTRNPLDNCLSIFFLHLEQQMSYALNLMDIGHYYREYRRLMAHWKTEFSADIFDFDYDALIREPQIQMQRLCAFLGLEWPGHIPLVAARSAAIRTASTWQVREPLYSTSSGRARHYADELKELRDYLDGLA